MAAHTTAYRKATARMLFFLGGSCAQCDMTNLEHNTIYGTDLELDHIDPATKSFNPKSRWAYRWDAILPEVTKCQPLCKVCHANKTHGGVS